MSSAVAVAFSASGIVFLACMGTVRAVRKIYRGRNHVNVLSSRVP